MLFLILKICEAISTSNYNFNYIFFTKLPWPVDCEEIFQFSSQAVTCPTVYNTRWRLHTVTLIAERQARKALNTNFHSLFGLSRLGIEIESTISVADALST